MDIEKYFKLVEKISKPKYKKICYKTLIVLFLYLFVRVIFQFLGNLALYLIPDKYFSYLEIFSAYELEILKFLYTIAIGILLFIFFESLYNRGFLRKRWSPNYDEIYKDFSIQGFLDKKALIQQNKIILTQGSSGMITKENFGDYRMTFSFKFHEGGFGIIYRALDLNHYFMLKIGNDYISPHISYEGVWEVQKNSYIKKQYKVKLEKDTDYNVILVLKGRTLTFEITGVLRFEYTMPCYFPFGKSESDTSGRFWASKLDFLKYGKIGFRAYGEEISEISNLTIGYK